MQLKVIAPIIYLILFSAVGTMAQDSWKFDPLLKQADEHYEHHLYNMAIRYYQEAEKEHPTDYYSKFQIAECYRQLFDYDNALDYYKLIIDSAASEFPVAFYYHGMMLKRKGNYKQSNLELAQFIESARGDKELKPLINKAEAEMKGNDYVIENFDDETVSNSGSLINLGEKANTSFNDYAVIPFENDNSLLLTSGQIKGHYSTYERFGESYTDFYQVALEKGVWKTDKLDKELKAWNSRWSDGAGWLNKTKDQFYFTRCPEEDKKGHCKIYSSEKINGIWQEPTLLNSNINQAQSDAKHPSVTVNNDTLFFVSDRPGGVGKNDIYMSIAMNKGEWGEAVNLGRGINTKEQELSPFYDELTKSFYFASEGHLNIGGIDLFRIKGNDFGANDVENLGPPINSPSDDYYLSIGNQTAFLSSNREGGVGKFDVYYMDLSLLDRDGFIVRKNRLVNSKRRVSRRSYLYISRNEDQLVYQRLTSNERSLVDHYIQDFLSRQEKGKEKSEINEGLSDDMKELAERMALSRQLAEIVQQDQLQDSIQSATNGIYSYENIYFDFDQKELRPEARQALNELTKIIEVDSEAKIFIKGFTDKHGDSIYNKQLSTKRSVMAKNYLVATGLPEGAIQIVGEGVYVQLLDSDRKLAMQLSRKIEISVTSKIVLQLEYDTFITLKRTSFQELAARTEISEGELKAINGTTRNSIRANKPVRLKRLSNMGYSDLVILEKDFME